MRTYKYEVEGKSEGSVGHWSMITAKCLSPYPSRHYDSLIENFGLKKGDIVEITRNEQGSPILVKKDGKIIFQK